MSKTFTGLMTDLGQKLNLDIEDSTVLANLKRWTNDSIRDFQNKYRWYWKQKIGYFQTALIYSTGTLTATNNSRTITGSGTTWDSTMVGRFIRLDGDIDWYEIIAVGSTTSLTLRYPYMRATASGKAYKIWKKYYWLYPDVEELIDLYIDDYTTPLGMIPYREGLAIQNGWGSGAPDKYIYYNIRRAEDTYTTGTVSGTINTKTLTGSGTSWLDNLQPGDEVTIGAYTYNVQTIESDTSITLCQFLVATVSAATSYSAERRNLQAVELNSTPPTYIKLMRYTYHQKTFDMLNDSDLCEVPDVYLPVIEEKVKAFAYASMDDSRESAQNNLYEVKAAEAVRKEANKQPQPQRCTWMS